MRKLLNYSIETDQLVWLQFSDGHHVRVSFHEVGKHLEGYELAKVNRAIKLRRDFFRNNLPKTMVALAAAGLATLLVVDFSDVATIFGGTHPLATPPAHVTGAAPVATSPSPSATPAPETAAPAAPAGLPAATPALPVPAVPHVQPIPDLQNPEPTRTPVQALGHAVQSLLELE